MLLPKCKNNKPKQREARNEPINQARQMKNNIHIFLFVFCINLTATGQEYKKAIITNINHFVRPGLQADKESFPFYFHHPEFITDIQSDILKYVKQKFGSDLIIFRLPDSIYYTESMLAPDLKSRELAQQSNDRNTVFISVETMIIEAFIINDTYVYHMITRVKAYRGKGGRKVYRFKNIIPFETYRGEEISGIQKMKEQDFYAFYFDGLKMAFDGDIKKTKKRYIEQPSTKEYNAFRNISDKYYLVQNYNDFRFGEDMNNLKEVLSYKTKHLSSLDNELDFGNIFEGNYINNGFKLKNHISGKEYKVQIKGGVNTLFNFFTTEKEVEVEFFNDKKEIIGSFTFDSASILKGNFENRPYMAVWNFDHYVLEIYSGKEKVLLVNYLNDRKVLFLRNNISDQELADLFNVIFAYDFAIEAKKEAEEKAANDAD